MSRYNVAENEAKWQSIWTERQSFAVSTDRTRPKYYVLEMFPYPSGRIHMGHVRNYTIGDVIARYKRARGFNVLHPMGWDAFGLPAENAALERGVHPGKWTYENIAAMRAQLQSMGLAIDWSREIATCRPEYYRHEQKMFLDFLKQGLAYRKESWVNWDPVDNTVLANEQVVDGRGWRTGALVEKRKLSQWFLKITDFADDLLAALPTLERWPEKVRIMQENWIGKSTGLRLRFPLTAATSAGQIPAGEIPAGEIPASEIEVFTTRPDTLFGASFLGISPNHPIALKLAENNPALAEFIAECNRTGTSEEAIETAEKKGFDTGLVATHPFDPDWKLPVHVANFVLMEYGTGAIFACPAHDQRDLDFARKYGLPVRPVVVPDGEDPATYDVGALAYTGPGRLSNSRFLDGMDVEAAKTLVGEKIEAMGLGERTTIYRLRDWGISRQRYWGCPIPVIHCPDCGIVPVPEEQLPVTLPEDVTFDAPGNPLARHPTWKHTTCPCCGTQAVRETDTFDTFIESSWYFLRFASPRLESAAFDKEEAAYWLGVDQYIGGIEHAVLHLLYARFWTRALTACGYTQDLTEPFSGLFTQGMVTHATYQDADGKWMLPEDVDMEGAKALARADGRPVTVGPSIKMSKSKKNVVDPAQIIASYGADAARLFMLSDSPPDRDLEWTESGIDGAWRYINRLWRLVDEPALPLPASGTPVPADACALAQEVLRAIHKTIAAIGEDLERFRFNKAVARIRELSNALERLGKGGAGEAEVLRQGLDVLVRLISPMMPHLAEELWSKLGHDTLVLDAPWPEADPALAVEDSATVAVQVNGKLRATLQLPRDLPAADAQAAALADAGVIRALDGKPVRKVIVIPNRVINVVV